MTNPEVELSEDNELEEVEMVEVDPGRQLFMGVNEFRARYRVEKNVLYPTEKGNTWVDIPESEPRCRVRLKNDSTVDEAYVIVDATGLLIYDETLVEVDNYPEG